MNTRLQAHRQCLREIKKRIIERPTPTTEELSLATYLELLEPQVRDAVREFNKKGYLTNSSGFHKNDRQVIDGFFSIDEKTKQELKKRGITITEKNNKYTTIGFTPKKDSLKAMEKEWNLVAALLPRKKMTNHLWNAKSRDDFKKRSLTEAFYEIGMLEYELLLDKAVKQKR